VAAIVTDMTPSIGSIVTGVDLASDMSDATIRRLIDLLHRRGVIVLQDQNLTDAQFVRFGQQWGRPLEFFIPEHRNAEFPAMIRVDNNPATPASMRDGAVHWHSDSSYEEEPAAVTMLYGREAPELGGETHFASTTAAYEALSEDMKTRLDGLTAYHELGKAPWIEGETQPDPNRPQRYDARQRHPLIMRHPVTGQQGIFTSGTACGIEGMEEGEAVELIRSLRSHVTRPEFRASYKILPGDIVLWDNFSTVHCASPIDYSDELGKRRLLYRISTKGIPDLCAPVAA
jgi:taurine dioxygenase